MKYFKFQSLSTLKLFSTQGTLMTLICSSSRLVVVVVVTLIVKPHLNQSKPEVLRWWTVLRRYKQHLHLQLMHSLWPGIHSSRPLFQSQTHVSWFPLPTALFCLRSTTCTVHTSNETLLFKASFEDNRNDCACCNCWCVILLFVHCSPDAFLATLSL